MFLERLKGRGPWSELSARLLFKMGSTVESTEVGLQAETFMQGEGRRGGLSSPELQATTLNLNPMGYPPWIQGRRQRLHGHVS